MMNKKRLGQLSDKVRSILVEQKYTEQMAKEICVKYNMLSPHYDISRRDGCGLCYNAPPKIRKNWFAEYPEAIELVIELQEMVKRDYPLGDKTPLRKGKWFIDTDQIDMFGNYMIN